VDEQARGRNRKAVDRASPDSASPSPPSARLPGGRHGLPAEFVAQNQRERIMTALVDTIAERGYHDTTIAEITKAASVSRRTFYEFFEDKEAAFLAAYDQVIDHICVSMRAAAEYFEEWPQQVRAALATMLRFLAAQPELARLCMIVPIAATGKIADRYAASMKEIVEILKAGRPAGRAEHPLSELTDETLVGGIVSLIAREITAGRGEQLEGLLPDLVELTLTSYLGTDRAPELAG
jgi:AcrR family transcriptional regulator